jgi:hypothetical protein
MNGVVNTGLTFWQLIGAIIALVLGVITIRIGIKFDLNRYLENRQKSNMQKLKNACTHLELIPTQDNQLEVRSFLVSPPGTLQWQCQRCGLVKHMADDEYERMANYYMNNLDEYHKKNKRFHKLLKKSGQI